MKKILITFFIVAFVLVAGCQSKTPQSTGQESTTLPKIGMITNTSENLQLTGKTVEVTMTAKNWEFNPSTVTVNKGDKVKLTITSLDINHGIAIPEFGVSQPINAGKTVTVEFIADKTGTFSFFCNVFCGEGHRSMKGNLIVK